VGLAGVQLLADLGPAASPRACLAAAAGGWLQVALHASQGGLLVVPAVAPGAGSFPECAAEHESPAVERELLAPDCAVERERLAVERNGLFLTALLGASRLFLIARLSTSCLLLNASGLA